MNERQQLGALNYALGLVAGLHEKLGDPNVIDQNGNIEEIRIRLEDAFMRMHYEATERSKRVQRDAPLTEEEFAEVYRSLGVEPSEGKHG